MVDGVRERWALFSRGFEATSSRLGCGDGGWCDLDHPLTFVSRGSCDAGVIFNDYVVVPSSCVPLGGSGAVFFHAFVDAVVRWVR